jgi:trigger factor
MHVEKSIKGATEVTLNITATTEDLEPSKNRVLKRLARQVKIPGFRGGKAPLQLIEKNIDPSMLQSEFLDDAMTDLYASASQQEGVRPVTKPEVNVKKFVPFTTLEFSVTTHVIGPVKLGKYKGLKLTAESKKVTEDDVKNVLESLKTRMAEKTAVERAAKLNDEVVIDFKGEDSKGVAVNGAEGKDYPLTLGSNAFIPGFEDNIIGLKPGEDKTFTIPFPKDYGVKALAGKKVTFKVSVKSINELNLPEVNDEFAAKVGPFKTVEELKADIKKQLEHEASHDTHRRKQNDAVQQVVAKSEVALPQLLVDQQVQYELDELRRNLTYRGQTYKEFLDSEGTTEEKYVKEVIEPRAAEQVKTGVILSEIAEAENIIVTPEELEIQLQVLKGQYKDAAMQSEIEKPENRRDIASRMLTEKVVNFLVEVNS